MNGTFVHFQSTGLPNRGAAAVGVVPMRTVLSSWKEIAAYLGKGVRTVQRWERELGLPVRRPRPNERQIVLAFPDELDAWLKRSPQATSSNGKRRQEFERLRNLLQQTMAETKRLQQTTQTLLRFTKHYEADQISEPEQKFKAS